VGVITLPWVLNPSLPANNATRAVDNISNIEQVTVDNPAAGEYTLRVAGTAVPSASPQQYTLTWIVEMPSIEITYPNGSESFDPSDVETISWTNAGVTGNQTIQYSIDNGANWITLSSTVAPTTTRFIWTVPDLNSAQAKVRVFSGALNDESDNAFSILGTPKGLTQEAVCQSGDHQPEMDRC
jgi:predicted phage tail protein